MREISIYIKGTVTTVQLTFKMVLLQPQRVGLKAASVVLHTLARRNGGGSFFQLIAAPSYKGEKADGHHSPPPGWHAIILFFLKRQTSLRPGAWALLDGANLPPAELQAGALTLVVLY